MQGSEQGQCYRAEHSVKTTTKNNSQKHGPESGALYPQEAGGILASVREADHGFSFGLENLSILTGKIVQPAQPQTRNVKNSILLSGFL